MTMTLHAQPYDLAAAGFHFENAEEFQAKSRALRNDYGEPVEEFEIQFIDGEDVDCQLAKAIGVNQATPGHQTRAALCPYVPDEGLERGGVCAVRAWVVADHHAVAVEPQSPLSVSRHDLSSGAGKREDLGTFHLRGSSFI